jgi:hypothetical protein
MSKRSKLLTLADDFLPEWGVAPAVSTAVPIAASGTEVKSTRDVSEAMHNLLLSRRDVNAFHQVRRIISGFKARNAPAFTNFRLNGAKSKARVSIKASIKAKKGR